MKKLPIGIQTFSEIRKEIYLVGIEFDENIKNISKFEWEKYKK